MTGVQPGRLKKRADFLRAAKGRRIAMPGLVLQMVKSDRIPPDAAEAAPLPIAPQPIAPQPITPQPITGVRVGFTVTKKIGNAVVRNRARRRLKAAAARVMPGLAKPGRDYVLIGREATPTRPFLDLVADLTAALTRIHGR